MAIYEAGASVAATPMSAFLSVLIEISKGESVVKACAVAGVPRQTFYDALARSPALAEQYGTAIKAQIASRFSKT